MSSPQLWLRCEKKRFEKRSALTPTSAKRLIDAGFTIFVERDNERIFKDDEFEAIGCKMVGHNSWTTAPLTIPILGLKELEESNSPLDHCHIHFAHCYKNQAGWSKVLGRFSAGGGTLYDLEFLTDAEGRRVAAFSYHAGFAGAAAGALTVAASRSGKQLKVLEPYSSEGAMVKHVLDQLGEHIHDLTVLVMGALGRCGRGAVDFCRKIGMKEENILKWDLEETAKGGPFPEICAVDMFVNCIYLSTSIPPFLTKELINAAGEGRKLSVVVDVSCDSTNPNNPIPIYNDSTTFDSATVEVELSPGNPALYVVAIDHLPTLLPREASERYSQDLLPTLLELPNRKTARVWKDAELLYQKKVAEALIQIRETEDSEKE